MKIVKIILAIAILLCLFNMPYGYYQFVRLFSFVGFVYLAYLSYKEENKILPFVFIGFSLLFQPFVKIVIHKQEWHYIDIAVALFLIISIFFNKKTTVQIQDINITKESKEEQYLSPIQIKLAMLKALQRVRKELKEKPKG